MNGIQPVQRRDYHHYLLSEEWKNKRRDVLAFWEYRCVLCYSDENVQVHHRTYERIGNERFTDLILLCDACHAKFHDKE